MFGAFSFRYRLTESHALTSRQPKNHLDPRLRLPPLLQFQALYLVIRSCLALKLPSLLRLPQPRPSSTSLRMTMPPFRHLPRLQLRLPPLRPRISLHRRDQQVLLLLLLLRPLLEQLHLLRPPPLLPRLHPTYST
jgi:hypothetical protein